jgi:hypothetical protein
VEGRWLLRPRRDIKAQRVSPSPRLPYSHLPLALHLATVMARTIKINDTLSLPSPGYGAMVSAVSADRLCHLS